MEESIHIKVNDELTFDRKLLNLEDDYADMQISPFDVSKVDIVK